MHRSKLAGFIIDCNTADLDAATEFWSNALGLAVTSGPAPESNYRHLASTAGGMHIEVQQVSHPSRVHLDIEADDIEAEVRRLERLGARRVGPVQTWFVMEAPTGQRFCVVRPQSPRFESEANEWSE
jgi:predicted enzyme related to lactoylglutathione lyase